MKKLPLHPNLEQLKKQAKLVLRGHSAGNPSILKRIQELHPRWRGSPEAAIRTVKFTLSDAQLVVAKEYGFDTWTKLKAHVEARAKVSSESSVNDLLEAGCRGDVDRLKALLDAHPDLINEQGGTGVRTALHEAVDSGSEAAVQLLLERGADPNIRCEGDNAMPLHFAAEKQKFGMVRMLIEHGADPIGADDYHELEVIGWATAWDYVQADREMVAYLLAHGARHNIFSAVAMGEVGVLRELVSRSPEALERRMDLTNKRRRPLHLAVVKKQPGALTALLELGANMESLDEAGFTALDEAALRGETAMAQTLLDRGAKVRLPAAFLFQRTRDIERLLRRDPEILKPGNRWGTFIIRASEFASGEVIEQLIQKGASVHVRDDPKTSVDSTSGYTALHAAAWRGNVSAAAVLMRHGANVQAREERYRGTPAGWADFAGRTEARDLILQGPVDIMEAVAAGLTERIKVILAEDPEALNRPFSVHPLGPEDENGWCTPLAHAVIRGRAEVVRLLLELGADKSVRAPDGRGLMEIAQQGEREEIVALLRA